MLALSVRVSVGCCLLWVGVLSVKDCAGFCQLGLVSGAVYCRLGLCLFSLVMFFFLFFLFISQDAAQGHKKNGRKKKPATRCSLKARVIGKINFGCRGVLTLPS